MNKLVIIGNGFDLAHGLPTRYEDFLLWYLKGIFKDRSKKTQALAFINVKQGFNEVYHLEEKSVDDILTIKEFVEYCKSKNLEIVYYFAFMKFLAKESVGRWVDVETEYFNTLKKLYIEYEKTSALNERELYDLNCCFDLIKDELGEYLNSLKEKDINEELKNTLMDVNRDNYNSSQEIMILNFNYTNTIEQYKNIFEGKKCEIKYIHGKLDDIENPIIFGYGDESNEYFEKIENVNNNELTRHLKSFLYLTTNNYKILFNFLYQGRFRVYVLGHSLGLSDRLLLNNIFEHEKFELIKLYFYQHKKGDDFFHKTQELSRHFKLNSKHLMRTKVIPYKNSKPLIPYKPKE